MKVNLKWYDWIVVNTSAGKDSQALMGRQASGSGDLALP
jgi:hypothetical protein